MLKILGVSRSGYNAWRKRKPSKTKQRKERLKTLILNIYEASRKIFGAPKITETLRKAGEKIAQRTVGKYMKEIGLKAIWVKHSTRTTLNSNFSHELKNVLNRQFNPDKPNSVWVTDITYIWTAEGFVYLNCIMDLFSRRIVAWTLSATLAVESVLTTLDKAITRNRKGVTEGLLVLHSDRGCQYTSEMWKAATEDFTLSYSDKGQPYDNACIESFHALIKREWLNRFNIQNIEQARILVFDYIETFYNTKRIHSHCDFQSPNEYEDKYYSELQKLEAKYGKAV